MPRLGSLILGRRRVPASNHVVRGPKQGVDAGRIAARQRIAPLLGEVLQLRLVSSLLEVRERSIRELFVFLVVPLPVQEARNQAPHPRVVHFGEQRLGIRFDLASASLEKQACQLAMLDAPEQLDAIRFRCHPGDR